MNWPRNLLTAWSARRDLGVQRVVVLWLEGLEIARVDRYLDEGLLHYLALLSDVGGRFDADLLGASDLPTFVKRLQPERFPIHALLPLPPEGSTSIASISAADRAQLERLISSSERRQRGVIACAFDMVARLEQLFGPDPAADEQHVIRDVYARMDENVGKALSLVGERTVLMVVISPFRDGADALRAREKCEVFTSGRNEALESRVSDLAELVIGLLKVPAERP